MKLLIFGDTHWSTYSSIVRSRGNEFSTRLENLIQSVNYVEHLANEHDCDAVVCLGDFFDKPDLSAEEVTALNRIEWSNKSHLFLVGNHEASTGDLKFNSSNVLSLCPNLTVMSTPQVFNLGDVELCLLPYINDNDRKGITDYFGPKQTKRIILSHNDIAGIQYGPHTSTIGFELKDITQNCDLFINGHLHNGEWIADNKVLNIGNLTGQNFGEDAFKYPHNVAIVDTKDSLLTVQLITNKFAMNFYKIDVTESVVDFNTLKYPAVVTVKCKERDYVEVKRVVTECGRIIEKRIIFEPEVHTQTGSVELVVDVDHIKQFHDFIYEKLGNTDVVQSELNLLIGR